MSNRSCKLAKPVALDGALTAGQTVIPVGASAVQILDQNDTRRLAVIDSHTGGSNSVYLGTTDSVGTGTTQYFRALDVGDTWELEHYSGDLYAIAGNSGYFAYLGVFEPAQ